MKLKDCIFCKIINNDIPSYTLYEDEIVKVFLDVNPKENGHMLIVPKTHISDFYTLDDKTLLHINEVAKKMSELLYKKMNCDGIRLITNHGICQEVKHFHLHILPIYKDDSDISDVEETFNTLKN